MRTSFWRLLSLLSALALIAGCEGDSASGEGFGTGQGGSMTRFAISGNYMYVVDSQVLTTFSIGNGTFTRVSETQVGFGLETIFAKGGYLYLGAIDAMYIWSIANPAAPSFLFRYQHLTSCDPVVVQGNRAYVTLRGGTGCNLGTNALEIIDISNPMSPTLIQNYPMLSPHGLGVDGHFLFICEGENGLKLFDISEENDIQLVAFLQDFFAYDVIARNGIATVTGEDGIFQLRYGGSGEAPEVLSVIPVVRQ